MIPEKRVGFIRSFPAPKTKKAVCAFLGTAEYYRCFINHFESMAAYPSKS